MPGYMVLLTAWLSGVITIVGSVSFTSESIKVDGNIWPGIVLSCIAAALFALSAWKAEKLVESTKIRRMR